MEDQRSITDDLSLVSGEPERADIAADSGAYADGDTGGDAWAAMEKSRFEASQTETARYNAADHAEVDVAALDLDLIPDGPRDGVDPVQSAEDLGELQHLIRALQALRAEKPMPEDLSSETVRERLLTDADAEAPDCVDDGCAAQAAETRLRSSVIDL